MDLDFSAEDAAFRDEVRHLGSREQLPADTWGKVLEVTRLGPRRDLALAPHPACAWLGRAELAARSSAARLDAVQRHIFDEECALAGAPRLMPFGPQMVAPVIMAFGNAEQQQRFLPRILAATTGGARATASPARAPTSRRCKTRAERERRHYIVNGQKTWTTLGAVRRLDLLPGAHRRRRRSRRRASRSC